MRTNFKFALMSAAALLSLGLASCSSNDEAAPENLTSDGKAVKTTFSISLPGKVAKTRMSAETVQASEVIGDFRGMDSIVIVPYIDADEAKRDTRLGKKNITLWYGTQAKPDAAGNAENSIPKGKLLANTNAVLFNDVTIPLRTSGFLFYGKATGTGGYANGLLTVAGMGDADEITAKKFTPTPIVDSFDDTKGVALATYVSKIAAAEAADQTAYPGATWAACANPANHTVANQAWYNADLGDRYTAFTSLKPGASQYVQACVQDLYSAILASTNPVAVAIKAAITDPTYASADASGKLTFTEAINGYPENNNSMPAGAVALTWSGATATAVASSKNNGMTVNTSTVAYPANLWYFVNSALSTANSSKKDEYNGSNTDWNGILSKYADGTSVVAATRSVAINKPIQYGVGRLDTKVSRLSAGTKYYDRQGVEVKITNGFTFTGVLIGGQMAVDYKFNQIIDTTDPNYTGTEYTIYDKEINTLTHVDPSLGSSVTGSNTLSTSADAGTNYTLALETRKDQVVNVALEFVNNGDDFYGVDGVVKKGCKFYMIAQLDPTASTVYAAGTKDKVFMQDHKTVATFSIAAGTADTDGDGLAETPAGFANAYVTIPDLRTPMLELGFSVNLHWEDGLTFTHEF